MNMFNFVLFAQATGREVVLFYDIFSTLCAKRGLSPSAAAQEIGIDKSNVSKWKHRGLTPRADALGKIAEYFGVSVNTLLSTEERTPNPSDSDAQLQEYLEELRNRPEQRMLFSITKNATKEEIEQAVKIIEALRQPSTNE